MRERERECVCAKGRRKKDVVCVLMVIEQLTSQEDRRRKPDISLYIEKR